MKAKAEISRTVRVDGVDWKVVVAGKSYAYMHPNDKHKRFKSQDGRNWKDNDHWKKASHDIDEVTQKTINAAVPNAIKLHFASYLKALESEKNKSMEKTENKELKELKNKGVHKKKGTKKDLKKDVKKKDSKKNVPAKIGYQAAIRQGLKKTGLFIKDSIDTLIGLPIALALSVLNPFYQLAHSTHLLAKTTKRYATSDKNIFVRIAQVFFNVILRAVILLPVQFVMNAIFAIPEALYRAVKGGVYGYKGLHIGRKGSITGALALPWVNLNWKDKKGDEGQTHLPYQSKHTDTKFSKPFNNDSYFFGKFDLFFLALTIGVLAGVAAAVIVSTGVAAPIVTTVVHFIATKMSINLAALSIPALSAVAFGIVTTAAFLATGVVEGVLGAITWGLNKLGDLLQAVPDKIAGRSSLKDNDFNKQTVKAGFALKLGAAVADVKVKSKDEIYPTPPVNFYGKLKAAVHKEAETLDDYAKPGSAA